MLSLASRHQCRLRPGLVIVALERALEVTATMTAGVVVEDALPVVPPPPQTAAEVQPLRKVYSYVAKNDVLQAEILWMRRLPI